MHLLSIQAPCVHQRRSSTCRAETQFTSLAFQAMGCWFELEIGSASQAIAEEMRDLVLDWHNRLSIFEPNSIVSRINCAQRNSNLALDGDMIELLKICDQLRIKTRGAFNITTNQDDTFTLQDHSVMKSSTQTTLNFGAIAKGFVLDLIRAEFRVYGIERAFIHGGTSSVLAMGITPWSIQVGEYKIQMQDLAAGVSELHSQSSPHIIDPCTTKPVNNSILQVVCIHESAAIADAYATACCVTPELVNELSDDLCTFIITTKNSTTIHDPLGVVQTMYKEAT